MDKKQFIDYLKSDNVSHKIKLSCCEFFVNNYPVYLQRFNGEIRTRLVNQYGNKIEITNGSQELVNYSFDKLKNQVEELEKFDNCK